MLSISNLHAGYGKVEVLHGISLEVPKGKVVTLIGSNGAGKTTTMRAVCGMIAPTQGRVTLGGKDVTGLEPYHVAKLGLAHSPEGRRVFATMSVTDNLLLGAFPRFTGSRPRGDVAADLERAMEYFPRLKERRTQLAGTLSGGEQQMLAMARAMMLNPDVVLLDEPFDGAGADPRPGGVPHHRTAALRGRDHAAGGTVRRGGVAGGGLRLCPGKRPHLDSWRRGEPAQRPRREGGVPRRQSLISRSATPSQRARAHL
jgi:branched-chain amino acid transport system ATP-binding protein